MDSICFLHYLQIYPKLLQLPQTTCTCYNQKKQLSDKDKIVKHSINAIQVLQMI